MSSEYDKPIAGFGLGLTHNSSDDPERDSYYLDFDKGIDSDIELEPEIGQSIPSSSAPQLPTPPPSKETSAKQPNTSNHNNKINQLSTPNNLPKLKNVAKQGEDAKPAKSDEKEPRIEKMPAKPGGSGPPPGDSKTPKPLPSPKASKPAASQTPAPSSSSRKALKSPETKDGSKPKLAEKPSHKKSDSDISKPQSSKPRASQSTSNLNQEPSTSNQARAKKPPTPSHSGTDDRTRTPKPRQSASNTSLDQLNKRPPSQRDPKHSPQRPPAGQTTPSSPADESFPSFDRRRDDLRRQRPPGNQNEQESMSEVPRRARRPNPPKSPSAVNHQNNIQGAPPHPPANGRIRHKRPDSGGDPDSGLWMTQTSTGRSETRFGPSDWDGTQELLPQNSVRSDLCGSCASLASQHGGQTDGIKPLAWREGVDGMITILSGMYGKVLIIMGISFPLAEVISHQLPIAFYEGFYLYLFGLSISFVCYIYLFVIGPEEGLLCCKQKLDKRRSLPSNYSPSGSFYLRIGAVFFGIASMIYSGLEFGQYFELASDSYCYTIMQALTPCAQMTFTFVQLYFIFFNSKLCIRKSRSLSKFGLMHLVATNICVWLHILIQESVHQIVLNWSRHGGIYYDGMRELLKPITTTISPFSNTFNSTNSSNINATSEPPLSPYEYHFMTHACRHASVIGRMVQTASPFMFPCTIEYSLICASILYIMWKNIQKKESKTKNKNETSGSIASIPESTRSNKNYYQVDCSNANKGLFMGIFFLVMCIIGLVLFYVLVDEPKYRELAVFELYVCELTIYFFTTIAVLVAIIQVRKLKYDPYRNIDLDSMLLIISQSGVYLYCVFGLISSHLNLKNDVNSVLSLLTNLIIIIQATLQTIFILDALRRNSNTPEQARRKPARESVTFLLICNLAMWIMNSVETHKADSNPTHLNFYGFWAWTIISHISTPLTIFYRFHSTVCLCEIWKKMYKPSKVNTSSIKY